MENKTDKPYSLQYAKEEVAIKEGFFNYNDAVSLGSYLVDSVAKRWAEKATEELQKQFDNLNTAMTLMAKGHNKITEELRKENEALKEKIKQQDKEYVSNGSIHEWKDYAERTTATIERLKESNKELVEALNDNKEAANQAMTALERYSKVSQKRQENLDLFEIAECLYAISNPDAEVFQSKNQKVK